jgi:sphinganine-1-phosphate aldolase
MNQQQSTHWIIQRIKEYFSSQTKLQLLEHALVTYFLYTTLHKVYNRGVLKSLASAIKSTSVGKKLIATTIENEVTKSVNEMFPERTKQNGPVKIPLQGEPLNAILEQMIQMKTLDVNPSEGKTFAYVYEASEDHNDFITKAHNLFIHSNALSPMAFGSLRKMETEIVEMIKHLLHGDDSNDDTLDVVGSLSSGGTESLELMVLTYRDRARELYGIVEPELILCETAHPAIYKAAHYFGVKLVFVPFDKDMKMDVEATEKAITKNTVLIVGSAPQYPHGILDPIAKLSDLALKHNIALHVDSCIGGLVLPFVEKLGYPVDPFDFRVKGVTSISADLHKYGYAPKGSSVILYRHSSIRRYQFYAATRWPGGLYISPTLQGTRGGGPIAAAWASLKAMGENGFLSTTKSLMETRDALCEEIRQIPELQLIGRPVMTIISFTARSPDTLSVYAIADHMEQKGWKMERQRKPDCIHMTIMPQHVKTSEQFITDLKQSVQYVKQNPNEFATKGTVAMYGMLAKVENADEDLIEDYLVAFMDKVYRV